MADIGQMVEVTPVWGMLHMPGNWGWERDVWRLHNARYIEQMNDPKMLLAKSREVAAKEKTLHAKTRRPEMKSQSPMVIAEIEKLERNPKTKWRLEPGYKEHIEEFLWKVPPVAERLEHYFKAGVGATDIHHLIGEEFGIVLCRSTIDKRLRLYNYTPQPLAVQLAHANARIDALTKMGNIMASDIKRLEDSVYGINDNQIHLSGNSVPSSNRHTYSVVDPDNEAIGKRKHNGYTPASKHHLLEEDQTFPNCSSMSEEITASAGLYALPFSTNAYEIPSSQDGMRAYGQSPASVFPLSNSASLDTYDQSMSPFGNLNSYQLSQSSNAATPYLQLMAVADSSSYDEAFGIALAQPQTYSEAAPLEHLKQCHQDNQVLKDYQIQPHMPQQTRLWLSNAVINPVHQPFDQASFTAQTRAEQPLPSSTSLSLGNLKPSNPESYSSL